MVGSSQSINLAGRQRDTEDFASETKMSVVIQTSSPKFCFLLSKQKILTPENVYISIVFVGAIGSGSLPQSKDVVTLTDYFKRGLCSCTPCIVTTGIRSRPNAG